MPSPLVSTVVVLFVFLASALRAAPWYSPVPVTAGATINAATRGGAQTVIVGGAGLVATSTDQRQWTRRTSGTTATLFGVAYGAGRFVAVGETGTIISSADGAAWGAERHPYTGTLAPDINGIIFANGRFVAVSRSLGSSPSENIITSTDGRTWTRQSVDRGGFQLSFVAFANGQYIAGGGGILLVSTDATAWRTVWTGQSWLYSGVRGGSRWVVTTSEGYLLTSADGTTWSETPTGQRGPSFTVAYRNGRFLAAGSNPFTIPGNNAAVFASVDGLAWTALPFPESAPITRRDTFRALLATDTGFLGFGNAGLMAETSDGSSWSLLSQPADRPHLYDVVHGNGLFVAVGDKSTNLDIPGINQGRIGAIYTSADGWNWQEQNSNSPGAILTRIAFGNGRFVAVGTGGVAVYSDDGVNWQRAVHPVGTSWQGIAFGAGRFVAVGRGTMISSDGITWEPQAATAANNYSIIRFVNGVFFVSAGFGSQLPTGTAVQRSTDGVSWTGVTMANTNPLYDVAFQDGLWIAASTSGSSVFEATGFVTTGALQISTDGRQWTAVRTPGTLIFRSVQRLSDRWVAGSSDGVIVSSTDGRSWRIEERPTSNSINRFANGPGYTVAVGDSATWLTTRDPSTLPPLVRPVIVASPQARAVTLGQILQLSATVSGTPTPTVQWLKNGVAIPGATSLVYTIAAVAESDAGNYTVVATNAGGSATSAVATITVLGSRIANLSIRSAITPASPELTVGFFVSGANKPLLVRAVGPTLAQFGVSPALARPALGIFAGTTPLVANEGWDRVPPAEVASVAAAAVRVGAFSLPGSSNDAAVLHSFGSGGHSAVIQSRAGSGTVLLEIYDADTTVRANLVNVSTLAPVGAGDDILVAGFVLTGNATKRLLIRAIGPSLTAFGRPSPLADPQMSVIPAGGQTAIATNDNWGGSAALSSTFTAVGAFALGADSKDAALLLSLEPGGYTVQVSGVGNLTGEALVEIYEVP